MSHPARRCMSCDHPMISTRTYDRSPWLRTTHRRASGRGLCSPCYSIHSTRGDLDDFERTAKARDEVLDDWEFLRSTGHTVPQAATRLGMTADALFTALYRAKRDGDPRAVFDYTGEKAARVRA